nr:uncharacterized protein K02A2.6-like [Dermacentor andersoni]
MASCGALDTRSRQHFVRRDGIVLGDKTTAATSLDVDGSLFWDGRATVAAEGVVGVTGGSHCDKPGPSPVSGGQGGVPYGGKELVQRDYSPKAAELNLQQSCLLCGSRVVIPHSLRSRILQLLHAGHSGVEKTKKVARSHVWWPGLDQDIVHMLQSCQVCQEHQRASHHGEITHLRFSQRPWARLHVDFGGPFKSHYFLVVVDAFSK